MNVKIKIRNLTILLNHRRLVHSLFPHVVFWRRHLGFVKPRAVDSKKQFNLQNAVVREFVIEAMKRWCWENIPKFSEATDPKSFFWKDQNWIFFEDQFRFRFENHHMAFVMEFAQKGNLLIDEAKSKLLLKNN